MTEARIKTSVALPIDLWRRVRHYAIDHDKELQEILIEALEAYLRKGGAR